MISEVYGQAKYPLARLEDQDVSYMLASSATTPSLTATASSGPSTVGHCAAGLI
jgi:hypothetical protein